MARKRLSRGSPDESHPLTQRMARLAQEVWKGNQADMARALGVSPPVISRILTGQQEPTGKVLAAAPSRPDTCTR